jgi:hypothetical protein
MTRDKKDHLWHSIACLSLLFFTSLALSGVAAWLDLLKIYNDDDHTLLIITPVLALLLTIPLMKLLGRLIQIEKDLSSK